jgi:hypothetical protein
MWQERELSDHADQVCLYCAALTVVFLFSSLCFTDSLAQITGMCAIEGAFHCCTERCLLGVLNHHGSPGDRLESDPLQTDRETECNDCSTATNQPEHARRLARESLVRQTTEAGEPTLVEKSVSTGPFRSGNSNRREQCGR